MLPYDDYQIMSLQCSHQRKFINICHSLSRSNDGKCCLSIQTFLPEQIHQIHFESVHNVMKIDIMSNCLVVCNPRSNIIYEKITPTRHTMAYLYAIHSVLYYYILSIQFGVSKNILGTELCYVRNGKDKTKLWYSTLWYTLTLIVSNVVGCYWDEARMCHQNDIQIL